MFLSGGVGTDATDSGDVAFRQVANTALQGVSLALRLALRTTGQSRDVLADLSGETGGGGQVTFLGM